MTKLKSELSNAGKTATNNRAGALCAMRKMMETSPTVAEPFVVADLALILAAAADKMKPVSTEADLTAKALIKALSTEGVGSVLPAILDEGDGKWQVNLLRAELLSTLATKAPKQMGRNLTEVVPVLSGLMWDTKAQVKEAATSAIAVGKPLPALETALETPATHAPSLSALCPASAAQPSRATRTRTSKSSCRKWSSASCSPTRCRRPCTTSRAASSSRRSSAPRPYPLAPRIWP